MTDYKNALQTLIEDSFNPTAKAFREFMEQLESNPELAALLNGNAKTAKKEKETKKRDKKAAKPDKKKKAPNAYIIFKTEMADQIKTDLLAQDSNLSGRDLQVAITKRAAEMWKEADEETKAEYKKKSSDRQAEIDGAEPAANDSVDEDSNDDVPAPPSDDEDEEAPSREFNETHNVWVDTDTGLAYSEQDGLQPVGQVSGATFKPFKMRK